MSDARSVTPTQARRARENADRLRTPEAERQRREHVESLARQLRATWCGGRVSRS